MRKLAGAQTRCLPFQDSARQRSGMRIRGVASHGLLSQTKLRNDPYSGLPWYGVLHNREHRPHVRAGIDRPIMAAAAPNSTMLTWELGLMLALTAPPSARAPCPRGSWEIVEGTILGGNSSTMPRWELGLTGEAGLGMEKRCAGFSRATSRTRRGTSWTRRGTCRTASRAGDA